MYLICLIIEYVMNQKLRKLQLSLKNSHVQILDSGHQIRQYSKNIIIPNFMKSQFIILQYQMKSKQSFFEQIISTSANKVMKRSIAGAKDQFQQRMKTLPSKIKQLNADPYMFIFDALISFNEEVDFTLTQYQNMMSQNFLNMDKNSELLVKHFRNNISEHSFRIIQILMEIKEPNLAFLELFFQIHNTIPMPENVAEGLRYNGYRWMSKTYAFRQMDKPDYIGELTSGILKTQNRNLPTYQDQQRSRKVYIQKIVKHMTYTVENDLKPQNQKIKAKWGLCFMCLQPADYYCKDTKAPMCGSTCKKAHIAYISNNPAIDYIYSQQFRQQVQKLLFLNLKKKKNMALSIDYLCSIYMNSDYVPKQALPHKQLLNSPVIVQRIWVLYTMYHYRRKEVFEHIFAECLKSKTAYVCISSAKYFLKIVQNNHIFEVYEYLDHYGYKRVIPIIINNLPEDQTKIKFISCLIDRIFDSSKSVNKTAAKQIELQSSTLSSLLRAVNFDENPLKNFKQIYGEKQGSRQMMKFIIKNQQQINKGKICQIVLQSNTHKTIFLQQLLLQSVDSQVQAQKKQVKTSVFLDEILRQIFYFINIKVSDSIYSLFQRLCQVLDLLKLKQCPEWSEFQLQKVFGPDNVTFKQQKDRMNTFFQFAYLIIMLVTELNRQEAILTSSGSVDKKNTKISTQAQFLNRVKQFDAKFAANKKDYIIATYHRLIQQSFEQKSRGILTRYPRAKKQSPKLISAPLLLPFSPVKILLDNWQLIYQTISTNKNDSNMLYRCCCCLTKFPAICRPFFQLLLNKLVDQPQAMKLKTSSVNIKKDENLIIFINNILQEQPNCIGVTSWKYLFLRDPQPMNSSHLYLFQISRLIHYSKSLSSDNFIYFVRQFCRNVRISQNFQQCLDLLQYNFRLYSNVSVKPTSSTSTSASINSSPSLSQQRTKFQILNKQYIQLFASEQNHYYQTQFMKAVFQMKNYELAITLLDIVPVNIISENLIVLAVVEVVEEGWKDIEEYGKMEKDREKEKEKDKGSKVADDGVMKKNLSLEEGVGKKQSDDAHEIRAQGEATKNVESEQQVMSIKQQSINKIWIHIIQKILTIALGSPTTLLEFSTLLHSIPQLHPYFQILSIQYAINSAFQGRQTIIHHTLTTQLHKFQQHIPQMYNTFSMMVQREGRGGKDGLLQQFVKRENMREIVGVHFGYFWEIQAVYDLIVEILVEKIKQLQSVSHKSKNNHELVHPTIGQLSQMLKILKDNGYLMLIRLQNRLQSITGFISAVTLYLAMLRSQSPHHKQQPQQHLAQAYAQYQSQLKLIASMIQQKIDAINLMQKQNNNNKMVNNNEQFSEQTNVLLARTYAYFTHVYNITYAYLYPIYATTVAVHNHDNQHQHSVKDDGKYHAGWVGPEFKIQQLCKSLRKVNRNYQYRLTIQSQSNSLESIAQQKFKHAPPSLHQQSHMCWCIAILSTSSQNSTSNKTSTNTNSNNVQQLYNSVILHQYLSQFLPIFTQVHRNILSMRYTKLRVNVKPSLQSQSSTNTNTNLNTNNSNNNTNNNESATTMSQSSITANNNKSNAVPNSNNSNNEQLSQFEMINQQIKHMKQTIKTIYETIHHRFAHSHHHNHYPHSQSTPTHRQIQSLLVQYMQLGFDFYQPSTKSMEFTQKQHNHHYVYQLYTIINQTNNKYCNIEEQNKQRKEGQEGK